MPPYHNLLPTAQSGRQEAVAPRASTSSGNAQNYKEPNANPSPFKCDFCSKGFTYRWNLECHLRDEHAKEFPFQCSKCRKGFFIQTDAHEHEAKCKSRPYKCDECEYATNDHTKLKNHQRRHTGEKPYQCDFCLELFTLKHSLDRHSINQHSDQFPSHCNQCGRGFLSDELATAHEINCKCTKYECGVCEFTTRDRTKLTNHQRKHTGEKPYQCTYSNCRRVFTLDRNLKRHRRDVHKFVWNVFFNRKRHKALNESNIESIRSNNLKNYFPYILFRDLILITVETILMNKHFNVKNFCSKFFTRNANTNNTQQLNKTSNFYFEKEKISKPKCKSIFSIFINWWIK